MEGDYALAEKKMINRNVAFGLAAITIVLAVTIAVIFASQPVFTLFQGSTTNEEVSNLQEEITQLQNQISDLKQKNYDATQPYLINVGLGASDLSTRYPWTQALRVTGYVVNTGSLPAYNAKLHVVVYFASGAKAIDTEISLGSGIISSNSQVDVNVDIPYSGGSSIVASSASLTPKWTVAP
jgi:hypothetical protein